MPEVVTADRPKKVRLFIQNVSDAEIYLNQGNRPGFDYPMARDAEGNKLRINRDAVYGFLISSSRRPEAYPGQSKGGAPFTSFTGLLLKPGAIWELKTHTALAVYTGHNANEDLRGGAKRIPREPGTNFVETQPIEAVVTWHLHSANGAEYTADWKRPLWPAKGGWSGVLRTAPVTVALRAAK